MSSESVRVFAIVPAAGFGTRMKQERPKQYLELNDKTILEHTLSALLSHKKINKVVVCIAESDTFWSELTISQHHQISSTIGGATRAQSVLNGLAAIATRASDNDWVLVHDAARPCISSALLAELTDQLSGEPVGGILAVPAIDTLKQVDEKDPLRITSTLDRTRVWQAQTPQMFRYRLLRDALQDALANDVAITDEASAMEWAGHCPRIVMGDARNIKVTTSHDLALASFLLEDDER